MFQHKYVIGFRTLNSTADVPYKVFATMVREAHRLVEWWLDAPIDAQNEPPAEPAD